LPRQAPVLTGSAAEITRIGEIIGESGHYRFTPGAMWEDYDRTIGKKIAATAA
jgi:hypothetical protein